MAATTTKFARSARSTTRTFEIETRMVGTVNAVPSPACSRYEEQARDLRDRDNRVAELQCG